MTKTMYIMTGLPGSGKSTEAHRLFKDVMDKGLGSAAICSADDFFYEGEPGLEQYKFDATKLGEAHSSCFLKVVQLTGFGFGTIIVDNTNLTNVERAPYVALAKAYKYDIVLVRVGCLPLLKKFPNNWMDICHEYEKRNVHGVGFSKIKDMIARYQDPIPYWDVKVVDVA